MYYFIMYYFTMYYLLMYYVLFNYVLFITIRFIFLFNLPSRREGSGVGYFPSNGVRFRIERPSVTSSVYSSSSPTLMPRAMMLILTSA